MIGKQKSETKHFKLEIMKKPKELTFYREKIKKCSYDQQYADKGWYEILGAKSTNYKNKCCTKSMG